MKAAESSAARCTPQDAAKLSHGGMPGDKCRLPIVEFGLRPRTEAGESLGMALWGSMRVGATALVGLGLALAAAGLARAEGAQGAPTFPRAIDRQVLVDWLRQETDITPAQVVAVSPSAVTAVLGTIQTASPKGLRMALRAEAIDAQVSDREGVLSWHMLVEVDCPGHRLRQGPTTGYSGRNLLGEGREIRPGTEAWSEPPAGSPLENVWRAACEPTFQRPLAAPRSISTAQAAPTPTPTPPAVTLRPMLIQDIHAAPAPAPPPLPTPQAKPAPQAKPTPAPPQKTQPAPVALRVMTLVSAPVTPRSSTAVQLGAMSTRAAAEAMLDGLRPRFAGAMHDLETSVTPATIGGKTIYRALITGFARTADAGRFCAGLKAGGVACFVR